MNMKELDRVEQRLELLQQLQKVDAPEYLFTRITEHIANQSRGNFSGTLSWVFAASLAVLVGFNVFALTQKLTASAPKPDITQLMNLAPDNSIYHE